MTLLMYLAVIMAIAVSHHHQVLGTRREHIDVTALGVIELLEQNGTDELLAQNTTNNLLAKNRSGEASGSILELDCKAAMDAGPWTFYYKEWDPGCQNVIKTLKELGKLAAFRESNIMKCFSGFEDLVLTVEPKLHHDEIAQKVVAYIENQNWVDPNEGGGNVPCEYRFSTGEDGPVWKQMEAAYFQSRNDSCASTYPHSTPAFVIENRKYCGAGELVEWLQRCGPELTWEVKSYCKNSCELSVQSVLLMIMFSIFLRS